MQISQNKTNPIPPLGNQPGTSQVAQAQSTSVAPQTPSPAAPPLPKIAPEPYKPKRLPWLYIISGAVLLTLVILGWISFGTVKIAPDPAADSVTINSKKTTSNSIKRLPGTLNIKIEKKGYLTYEKKLHLGFNGTLNINPKLKKLPEAVDIGNQLNAPLTAVKDGGGIKAISLDRNYLTWSRFKGKSETSVETLNLNLDPLAGIRSVQYPTDQRFALLSREEEVGVLDFAKRDITSQEYSTFGKNIRSIALSSDGEEVFYWQYDTDLKKNFMVRNNIAGDKADRYFDQPLIDQLDLTDPILKWSEDKKFVLAIENKVVLIDIINRQAKVITYGQDIKDAWTSPDNKTLVAISGQNKLVTIDLITQPDKELSESQTTTATSSTTTATASQKSEEGDSSPYTATEHEISTTPSQIVIKDDTNVLLLDSDNQLIEYNFDSKTKIKYLLDESLSKESIKALAADFSGSMVYFLIGEKIYSQPLVKADYD